MRRFTGPHRRFAPVRAGLIGLFALTGLLAPPSAVAADPLPTQSPPPYPATSEPNTATTRPAATASALTRPAAPPATEPVVPSSPEIEGLLKQFLSDNWRLREQAQDRLAELADAAEPRLRQFITTTENAEARTRAQAALLQIAAVRRLGPTLVTLHLKDAPPGEAFAELSRQGRIHIAPQTERLWQRSEKSTITIDRTDEPFWSAMRRLCSEFGVRALFTGGDNNEPGRIILIRDATGEMTSPAAFNGSFMLLATSVVRKNAFDRIADDRAVAAPGADPGTDLKAEITFFADPKWRILEHPEQTTIESANDDQGRRLPAVDPMRMQVYSPDSPIWLMRTDIRHVPAGCKKLLGLKGSFHIILLEQSESIQVPHIMTVHNVVKKVAGRSVQFKDLVKDKDSEGYKLHFTLFRGGLSTQAWRQQRESQGVQLLDERDRPLTRGGYSAEENGDQVDYEINFFKVEDPAKPGETSRSPGTLIFQLPLEPKDLTVPFEFKDLPIEK